MIERITMRRDNGTTRPFVRHLPIAVSSILSEMADGATTDEILRINSELEADDITASLRYAAAVIDQWALNGSIVVRGSREGRTQIRNYVLEGSLNDRVAREFWFRDSDDVCVYSRHQVILGTISSIESSLPPIEGVAQHAQPQGTYLPPSRR